MEYITLNNSNLKVSRLCMGGCPMGGYGWGETQESELIDAVHTAIDQGINYFDTADTYGLGQSEITLGKALGNHRNNVVIQSKFGVRVKAGKTTYDNSPDYIQLALEQSLKRLGTEYIDIYVIHYRDGKTPIDEVIDKLIQLRKQGKIRYFGLSNIHGNDLKELLPYREEFVCCQDEYSLACRKHEQDLINCLEKINVNPLTWGSLGQGILTGKYTRTNVNFDSTDRRSREIYVNFHGDKLQKNLEIVEEMKKIAEKHNKSIAGVAIRFILDYLPQSIVLCGAKRSSQVMGNCEGLNWHLTAEEIDILRKISC